MSLEVVEPVPKDRPGNQVATKQLTNGILIRLRRRCWLSVASAEHACQAQEAGHSVEIYLVELKPIWRFAGWSA